jgi:hypothetical protein
MTSFFVVFLFGPADAAKTTLEERCNATADFVAAAAADAAVAAVVVQPAPPRGRRRLFPLLTIVLRLVVAKTKKGRAHCDESTVAFLTCGGVHTTQSLSHSY